MKEIILASSNQGKMRELREITEGMDIRIIPLSETGFTQEIEENGSTFAENATIKAETVCNALQKPVLADDSGLEIDYLDRQPGIYSARFLGRDTPYSEKNRIILEKLSDAKEQERTARFVCAMALAVPGEKTIVTQATMEGRIAYESKGENGFGYDPIFFLPEYGMTSAQISPAQKNEISHRGKALRMMKEEILKRL